MLHFIVITITIILFLQLQNINFVLNHTVHQLCTIVCAFDLECYSVSFGSMIYIIRLLFYRILLLVEICISYLYFLLHMNISYEVTTTIELAKILDVDVDRIILQVKAELLLKLPLLLLVELVNTPQFA